MPVRHSYPVWPGMEAPLSGTYTVSHGITAGVAEVTCLPQLGNLALQGNLIFTDGARTITIPDCRLANLHVTRGPSGQEWHLMIEDRRWRWRETAMIAGCYNQTDPIGLYYLWTVRTPAQLCALCLQAMGEVSYTIDVPNIAIHPVNWDYTTPAQALQQLADALGCRVMYRLDTDSVHVGPIGRGAPLPAGSIYSDSPSLGVPARPDSIVCVGAPIRVQARFRLQAVGKDWDGLYRPLDALSYKPSQLHREWKRTYPPTFNNVESTTRLTEQEAKGLARESVYRCYQLTTLAPTWSKNAQPLDLPYFGKIVARREQILLESSKVEQVQPDPRDALKLDADGEKIIKHFYDGFKRDVPAECYGSFYNGKIKQDTGESILTSPLKKINISFSIDPVLQIITFSEPLLKFDAAAGVVTNPNSTDTLPSDPVLETGCTIRAPDTNQVVRYEQTYVFPPPGFGTLPLYIVHEDVQFNVIGDYDATIIGSHLADHTLKGIKTTSTLGFPLSDVTRRADLYLAGAAARFQLTGALTRVFNGLEYIWLDGVTSQVTWNVGEPEGSSTQVSQNSEHSVYVPPYPQRLKIEYQPAITGAEYARKNNIEMWKPPDQKANQ